MPQHLPAAVGRAVPRARRVLLATLLTFLFLVGTLVFYGSPRRTQLQLRSPSIQVESVALTEEEQEVRSSFSSRARKVRDSCAAAAAAAAASGDQVDGAAAQLRGYERLASRRSSLQNIIVNDEYKVLYCYVPKVACTNWKKVLILLTFKNMTDVRQINSDSVHRKDVFPKLSDMKEQDIIYRLQTYDKFLFVRHPFDRLVSAFRNKFVMNYTSSAYFKKRFGVNILKRFRKQEHFSRKGDGVRFDEFVQYLIETFDRNSALLNEHWAPYSQLCHPCGVRYNLIGKYKTLEKDAKYILKRIKAPTTIKFPPVRYSRTSKLVESYLYTLTANQLDQLLRIFDKDFTFFHYNFKKKV